MGTAASAAVDAKGDWATEEKEAAIQNEWAEDEADDGTGDETGDQQFGNSKFSMGKCGESAGGAQCERRLCTVYAPLVLR